MALPQDTGLAESLEAAQKRREADAEFINQQESADFSQAAEGLKQGLGIAQNSPEDIEEATSHISEAEEQDPENNPDEIVLERDLLDAFDNPDADDTQKEGIQVASLDQNIHLPPSTKIPEAPEQNDEQDPLRMEEFTLNPAEKTIQEMEYSYMALGGENPSDVQNALTDPEKRVKNSQRAEELFFSNEKIESQISLTCEKNTTKDSQETKDWYQTNILNQEGPLHKHFENIKGNFVIPDSVTEKNIGEICDNSPENARDIHNTLVDAILLEVHDGILNGKMNYSEEKVQKLIGDIKDINSTPLEKLEAFGEIRDEVETSVGQKGAKQSLQYRKTQQTAGENQAQNTAFQEAQAALIAAQTEGNAEKIAAAQADIQALKNADTHVAQGEATGLGGGALDTVSSGAEQTSSQTA